MHHRPNRDVPRSRSMPRGEARRPDLRTQFGPVVRLASPPVHYGDGQSALRFHRTGGPGCARTARIQGPTFPNCDLLYRHGPIESVSHQRIGHGTSDLFLGHSYAILLWACHAGREAPVGGGDLLLHLAGGWLSRRKVLALQDGLRKQIPALGSTQVEFVWEGANHVASDGLPRIGRLGPSLYAVSCSAGIGQAVLASRMAADLVSEPDSRIPDFVAFGRRTGRFPRLSSPLSTLKFALELLGLAS